MAGGGGGDQGTSIVAHLINFLQSDHQLIDDGDDLGERRLMIDSDGGAPVMIRVTDERLRSKFSGGGGCDL